MAFWGTRHTRDHQGVVWGSFIIFFFVHEKEEEEEESLPLVIRSYLLPATCVLLLALPVKQKNFASCVCVCEQEGRTPIYFFE